MRAALGCGPFRTIRLFVSLTVPSVVLSPSGWAFLNAGCNVGRTLAIVIARMTSGRGWHGRGRSGECATAGGDDGSGGKGGGRSAWMGGASTT